MECEDEVKKSLAKVMQRVDMDFNDISKTTTDICLEFNFLSLDTIREALRKGSLGNFGITFKLSTQTVCFWIREHHKQTRPNTFL